MNINTANAARRKVNRWKPSAPSKANRVAPLLSAERSGRTSGRRSLQVNRHHGSAQVLREYLLAVHGAAGLQPKDIRGRLGGLPGCGGSLALRVRPGGASESQGGYRGGGGPHQHPARYLQPSSTTIEHTRTHCSLLIVPCVVTL